MSKFEDEEYRSVEEFRAAIGAFHGVCGLLLFAFAKQDCDTKNVLIRNFIARTDTMVRGVLQLWDILAKPIHTNSSMIGPSTSSTKLRIAFEAIRNSGVR